MNATGASTGKVDKDCEMLDNPSRAYSFEAAALPHINELFRMAQYTIGNRGDAEELVQETYLQAWKSFDRFEPGTNCRAWLFKILFHMIQHHRRKWFRFKMVSDAEEIMQTTLIYEPPVPQHISDEDVLLALERVPQQYREVILLADVHEFSYKEIAEMLSVPLGTVMSRLSRGRKLLRVELAEFASDYGIATAAQDA